MTPVILVPRRTDHGPRDRTWAWVRDWWQAELGLPIYEGLHDERDGDGLFSRSLAVNRAAQAATSELPEWDVALIIDSDVFCHPPRVREALERALETGDRLVLPFDRRHNLGPSGSSAIMAGDRGSWRRYIARTYTDMCSSAVAVPRRLWDAVGGFDEQFRGWGFEDNAFAAACETYGAPLERIPGELWHLWHPTAPEGRKGTPSYTANRRRRDLYDAALGDRATMARLIAGESVKAAGYQASTNIPRILHRTVPAETTAETEAWWQRFGELHPGWALETYREPLDPRDWPLTGRHWRLCRTGAQKAGLIRLEALYRHGGVYVDSDVEPYRSLEPLLATRAFAAWEDARCVPDAVLGAEPEHPAIKACLELAIKRLGSRLPAERSTWETGPGVTTTILPGRPDVLVLPPGAFYPYHYAEKERRGEPHEQQQPWAFMAHHWAGSWLARKAA